MLSPPPPWPGKEPGDPLTLATGTVAVSGQDAYADVNLDTDVLLSFALRLPIGTSITADVAVHSAALGEIVAIGKAKIRLCRIVTNPVNGGAILYKGERGATGDKGDDGADGKSAYELALENGYEGTLLLDHTSVTVRAKGYDSETENLSANRKYADLPDADLSLIPKSVNEDGKILTLTNVQWSGGEDGEGNPRFSASATYSGTSTTRHATGYTVTANYTGRVAKTNCDIVTYTLTFAGTPIPPPAPEPEPEPEPEETVTETEDESVTETPFPPLRDVLSILGCIGGAATLGGAALCVVEEKSKKGKRTITNES